MMRKGCCLFLLLTIFAASAMAATTVQGRVVPNEAVSIQAPFGGTIDEFRLRAGMYLSEGDVIARIGTTKVMASEDGTITGINAQPGDTAEQTVLYLAPVSKYTVACSLSKAYDEPETLYVELGEKVYIKCSTDGSHRAVGRIVAINGSEYTVETSAGELYMEETVLIYRTSNYLTKSCIGSGKVNRTAVLAVKGTGSILHINVEDGEEVERGQTLFETVDGGIDAYAQADNTVYSEINGIIAELAVKTGQRVAKGDTLLTVFPEGSYQLEAVIPQDLLSKVQVGKEVSIFMDWDEDKSHAIPGTVTGISYVANTGESEEKTYNCYIAFQAEQVRIGMNAHVQL